MISRLLPAVNSAASHLPPGMRRTYGDLSNRVLDMSSVYRTLRSTVAEMGSALLDFSRPPVTDCERRVDGFASLIRPWTARSLELQRVGGALDGAYVMAPIGPVDGALDGMELRPLEELRTLAGMSASYELLLKVDVEGAEWSSFCATDFAPYQQVLLEMHDLSRLRDTDGAGEILSTARGLAATHLPAHVHANNEGTFKRYDGRWLPDVIEVSHIRRDLLDGAAPATSVVAGLDRPSNPKYPDYYLTGLLTVTSPA